MAMSQAKLAKKRTAKNQKRKGKKYNPYKLIQSQPTEQMSIKRTDDKSGDTVIVA